MENESSDDKLDAARYRWLKANCQQSFPNKAEELGLAKMIDEVSSNCFQNGKD